MSDTNEILRTATFGTTEVQYSDHGRGEPLVLVHAGVFADWFVPLAASDTIRGFRVLRVRRAGYGQTPPSAPVSIADHAQHLAALLRLLEIAKAHVVGHSSGALIALHLAAEEPDMVQSLTLIEPAP